MSFSDSKQVTNVCDEFSSEQFQKPSTQDKGFDYSVLTPQARTLVEGKTCEIKSLIRRNVQEIVDIGQNLIEVKAQLGHGNFRAWLKAEFDWSIRTVSRFMQVATKFKCANLAHLNIAVSALYLLAESSTSEQALKEALEIASEGENVTCSKAKVIIERHRKQAMSTTCKPGTIKIPARAMERNVLTLSQPYQSAKTDSRLEPSYGANSTAIKSSGENIRATESCEKLEHKAIEEIDSVSKEDLEVPEQLESENSNKIQVLNIKYQNPQSSTNIAQTYELTYAGVCINMMGNPKALTVLFEQMHKNSAFMEKVLEEAKLLSASEVSYS